MLSVNKMEGKFQISSKKTKYWYVEVYRQSGGFRCSKMDIDDLESLVQVFRNYNSPLGEKIFEADAINGVNFLATLGYRVCGFISTGVPNMTYLLEKIIDESSSESKM